VGARDRTDSGFPDADIPEQSREVRGLRSDEVPQTLAAELIPIVDEIRQLAVDLGANPYRVFLIHEQWPGPRRGQGDPVVISCREIVPPPKVSDMTATRMMLRSVGLTEEGSLLVSQISGHYTEDDLLGKTLDLQDPVKSRTGAGDVDFFWEVVENRPSNPAPVRRRYRPDGVPMLSRDGFQWKVPLVKAEPNRSRQGAFTRTAQ
jgi:hypothetical protein